jgi:hypothetical protein
MKERKDEKVNHGIFYFAFSWNGFLFLRWVKYQLWQRV